MLIFYNNKTSDSSKTLHGKGRKVSDARSIINSFFHFLWKIDEIKLLGCSGDSRVKPSVEIFA